MAIPSSGSLALSAIQTEFGGSNPISMSEYYAGGSNVPSGTTDGDGNAIPSSGALAISDFYDTSAQNYNEATGGTVTTSGNDKIHTFTSDGTFTVSCAGNSGGNDQLDYMVVAAGGGGGADNGGGGESHTNIITWKDPLAQTFLIEDTAGIFLTKVDIFFSEKDASIPVAVSIRPTLNGVPTNQDIPGAIKFLPPSAVNVTAEGSSIDTVRAAPTTFEFEEPVYLSPYSEYAVVISAETNGYKAYVAESGEFVVNSTERRVTKQPSMGSLFKSQNGSTWSADQSSDLMFKLHRANFRNVGTAMLENTDVAPVLLDTDPISVTSGSTTYTVFQPGHGFMVGDDVILGGVTGPLILQKTTEEED